MEKGVFKETDVTLETNISGEDVKKQIKESASKAAGEFSEMAKETGKRALDSAKAFAEEAKPVIKESVKTARQAVKDAEPKVIEAGKKAKEALEKMHDSAAPVINDAAKDTMDFIRELQEDTKPE